MFKLSSELKHFAPNLPDSAAHKTLTFLFEPGRLPNLPDSSHHKKRPKESLWRISLQRLRNVPVCTPCVPLHLPPRRRGGKRIPGGRRERYHSQPPVTTRSPSKLPHSRKYEGMISGLFRNPNPCGRGHDSESCLSGTSLITGVSVSQSIIALSEAAELDSCWQV